MTEWEQALEAVWEVRRHLSRQQAQEKRVNKRRDQIDRRMFDIEMAVCWLIQMAKDESKSADANGA